MDNYLLDKHDEKVTAKVSQAIARNLKDILSDDVIAERTGLPIEVVKNL